MDSENDATRLLTVARDAIAAGKIGKAQRALESLQELLDRSPSRVLEVATLRAERDAARAELAEAGWMPIETAPKTNAADLRAICLEGWCPEDSAHDGGDVRIIWWEPKLRGGTWWSDRNLPEEPTLWRALRPLPTPPTSAAVPEGDDV